MIIILITRMHIILMAIITIFIARGITIIPGTIFTILIIAASLVIREQLLLKTQDHLRHQAGL